MVLWKDRPPPEDKPSVNSKVKEAASALRKFGASQSWPTSKSPRMWELPLAILAKQVGHDEMFKAVQWYVSNHPGNMGMKLYNGKDFRQYYTKVLQRMEKCQPKMVEVDAVLKATVGEIKGWGWPKGSKSQVGAACQLTFDVIKDFRKRIGKSNRSGLSTWLLEGGMGTPLGFVEEWMRKVHKRVANWDDWHGDLLKEVPKPPADKRFNQWGREIAEVYSTAKAWDKLVAEVYE